MAILGRPLKSAWVKQRRRPQGVRRTVSGSAAATLAGATGSFSGSAGPAPVSAMAAYRNNQQYLFQTVQQYGLPSPLPLADDPLTPGNPNGNPFVFDRYGTTRDYVVLERGWAWRNAGGDWIDRNLALQGTTPWVSAFTGNNPNPTTYNFDCTAAVQYVQANAGKWNAWIVTKTTTTPRVMCGKWNANAALRPRIEVTYTDGTTATLLCRCSWSMAAGSTTPSQTGETQSLSTNWNWALEFQLPTKAVQSARLWFSVAEHWGGSDTLKWNLADPPLNTNPAGSGIASGYTLDNGLGTHPSIIFSHRYQDGSSQSDWCFSPATPFNVAEEASFSPEFWGGPVDTTKLPYAGAGKWLRGVLTRTDPDAEFDFVPSTYTGDPGFVPLAPGIGAIKMTMPPDYSIEGGPGIPIQHGDHIANAGTSAINTWMMLPPNLFGLLNECWSRCYVFVPNPIGSQISDNKRIYSSSGPLAWTLGAGKISIPVPAHQTPYGGNSNQGGGGLGWSNRFEWHDEYFDYTNPENPLNNAYGLALSWVDFQRTSEFLSSGAPNPKYPYTQPLGYTYVPDPPSTRELGQQGGLGTHIYAGRWYCIEIYIKLNSVTTPQPSDNNRLWAPDGVYEIYLDNRLIMRKTGTVFRSLPIYDPGAGASTDRRPCREMGVIGIWANWFHGGNAPSTRLRTMYMTGYAFGTQRIGPMRLVVATALTLSGPSSGTVGVASNNFTVGVDMLPINGTVTVTPSDGNGGGSFTPPLVNLTTASPTATFTYTAVSAGTKTIGVTNNGGLTNPANISYTAAAQTVSGLLPSRPGSQHSTQIPGPANWLDTTKFPLGQPWTVYDSGNPDGHPKSFARSMGGVQPLAWRKVHPWGMPSNLYGRTPILYNGRIKSLMPQLGDDPDYIKAVLTADPEFLVAGARGRCSIHPYITWDSHTYTLSTGGISTSSFVPMWIGIAWLGEVCFLMRDGSMEIAFTVPITTWAQDWTAPVPKLMYVTDTGAGTIIEVDRNFTPPVFTTRVTGLGQVNSIRAIGSGQYIYAADSQSGTIWKIDRTDWSKTAWCSLPGVFCIRHDSQGRLLAYTLSNNVHRIDMATGVAGPDLLVGVLKNAKLWVWLGVDRNGTCGEVDAIYCITSHGTGNTDLWRIRPNGTVEGHTALNFVHDIGPTHIGKGVELFEAAGHYPWVVAPHENDAAIVVQGFSQQVPAMLLAKHPNLTWPNEGTYNLFLHGMGLETVAYGVGPSLPIGSQPSFTCEMNYSGGSSIGLDSDYIGALASTSIAAAVAAIKDGLSGIVRRDYISGDEMKALLYYLVRNSQAHLIQGATLINQILAFNYGPTPTPIVTLDSAGRRPDAPDAFAELYLEGKLEGSTSLRVFAANPDFEVAIPAGTVCDLVIDWGMPGQITRFDLASPWTTPLPSLTNGPHSLVVNNIRPGGTTKLWGRASLIEIVGAPPPPTLPAYVPTVENTVRTLSVANGLLANNLIDICAPYYQETKFYNIRNGDSGPAINPYWGPYGGYMLYGCGHASTNDNTCAILEFGQTQARFKRLTNPTPLFGSGTDETTQSANSDTSVVDRDYDIGEYLLDRQPWSAHTYGSGDVVGPANGGAANGTYYAVAKVAGGQGGNGPSGGSVLTPHKVDMATTTGATGSYTWQRVAGYTGGGNITVLSPQPCWTAFVPAQNRIYFEAHYATAAQKPRWYDRTANAIVVGTGTARNNSNLYFWGCRLLHVPERNLLIFAWCTNNTQEIRIVTMSVGVADTNPSWNNTPRTLSQTLLVPQGWSHICWCPTSQRLIVGASTPTPNSSTTFDTVYEITIPADLNSTWTVEAVPLPSGVTLPIMNQGPALGTPCYKGWDWCAPIKAIAYYPIGATNNTVPTPYADSLYFYKPRGTA